MRLSRLYGFYIFLSLTYGCGTVDSTLSPDASAVVQDGAGGAAAGAPGAGGAAGVPGAGGAAAGAPGAGGAAGAGPGGAGGEPATCTPSAAIQCNQCPGGASTICPNSGGYCCVIVTSGCSKPTNCQN